MNTERILRRGGWVIALALVWGVAGLATFQRLPRDLFPDLSLPTLQLLIQSPGRTAEELELAVAQPVEQALSGLPDVRRLTSTVQAGLVQVVITFAPGVDPWRSRQQVSERLAQVVEDLPPGTTVPLATSAAGRLQEIQELVLEGPRVDPMRLRDHAVQVIVPRLQGVPGVARVELLGGEERQLQVTVNPEAMRLHGVGLDPVITALDGSERDTAAGQLELRDKTSFVTFGGLAATPEQVRHLPVHTAHGVVALGDLAEVREAPAFRQGLARYQGYEVVSLRVVKQPTAEVHGTARAVRAALPELQEGLPEGMSLRLFYDQGELVDHALGGVSQALLAGAGFVALVLVLLLGNLRAAAIVILLLPLATLGAALPLYFLGLGLNAMTLGGLAIAVGLLVDAGVIMVENLVHRLHEPGTTASSRARIAAAAGEVAVPILTAVLVILAVFLPLLAMGGVAGKLYAPLTVAVAAAMTTSLVLSFTLVPVLFERWVGASGAGSGLALPRAVVWLQELYRPVLGLALRHGLLLLALGLAATGAAGWLAARLGSDFLPALDERALMLQTNLPADTSLAAVDAANLRLEEELSRVPGVSAHYRRTGRGEITEDPMPHHASDILVIVTPEADLGEVAAELVELAEHQPFGVELTTPMGMKISEGIGGTPADIQVKLFAADLAALAPRLPALVARLAAVPGVLAVNPDAAGDLPRWRVSPDDDALRRLDVPRGLVFDTLRAALQGIPLAPRYNGAQRVDRVVRFPHDGRLTAAALERLPLVVEEGRVIELGQVARLEEGGTASIVRRETGRPRLGFNLRTDGDLVGTARRVEAAVAELRWPPGVTVALGGRIEEARETQRRLLAAGSVALTLVLGLLYFALGRWREVAVVLATLPSAFAGALLALWLAGETWNVSSIVGLIGLFGVAVQNSLVLILQTRGLRDGGLPFAEALTEAAVGRLRPKLMTAGCAILGLAPMLFGLGGSELERPLAVVMVGGLVSSTLFTLLVLPGVYARVGGRNPR